MPRKAQIYIAIVLACSAALSLLSWYRAPSEDYFRFLIFLGVTAVASAMKVKLPGVTGTYSLNFLVILIAAFELRLGEAVAVAIVGAAVQCLWRPRNRPAPVQVAFSAGGMAISTAAAYGILHSFSWPALPALALAAAAYFALNTLLVSIVLCLVENKPLGRIWEHWALWAFPYYLVGIGIAGAMCAAAPPASGWTLLYPMPLMYLAYRCYRGYVGNSPGRHASGN